MLLNLQICSGQPPFIASIAFRGYASAQVQLTLSSIVKEVATRLLAVGLRATAGQACSDW